MNRRFKHNNSLEMAEAGDGMFGGDHLGRRIVDRVGGGPEAGGD